VVFEDNPIYPNLVGRVDSVAQFGTLVTNFTLIKPGALHRANGGYLVLDAAQAAVPALCLGRPEAGAALGPGAHRIAGPGLRLDQHAVAGAGAHAPQRQGGAGRRARIYYLLKATTRTSPSCSRSPPISRDELPRNPANTRLYAEFLATLARAGGLRPLDREAVARVIEHAARLAGDAERSP
jgi:hypothetical protein